MTALNLCLGFLALVIVCGLLWALFTDRRPTDTDPDYEDGEQK